MRQIASLIAVWITFVCLAPVAALAAAKHAFVVGIGVYDTLPPEQQLPRAKADAAAVAATLKALDYEVVTATDDLTLPRFNLLWTAFLENVQAGDTVTIFFSSHGVHIDGNTYLMPRDVPRVQATRQELLKRSAISVAGMLDDIKTRKPRVTVLILDACRNNPFEAGSTKGGPGPGGLGGITAPLGTLVMYAAGEGEKALEKIPDPPGHAGPASFDTDPHSLYTRRLLPLLAEKGLDAVEMARRLKTDVREMAKTAGHNQSPSYYDNIVGKFCFAGCEAPAPQPPPPAVAQPAPATTQAYSEVAQAWASVANSDNPGLLESFIKQYDGTFQAALARDRLATIRREAVPAAPAASPSASKAPASTVAAISTPSQPPPPAPAAFDFGDVLRFDQPIPFEQPELKDRSLKQLVTEAMNLHSPVDGIPEPLWKKTCNSCHNWDQAKLCAQANVYFKAPDTISRKLHPLGSPFKIALLKWAKNGCK